MNKKIILVIIVLGLLCSAAVISVVIWRNAPVQKQARQLELGNHYLEEMNYEQAKVVFEELITIDPSNVEAYLGAAKAYVGLEDYEGAVTLLQKGYEQTGSEEIKMLMEEYEQKLEEQKAEAEQALREEIEEYMRTIPMRIEEAEVSNPIYTYSYFKKVYPDVEAKLQEYLKKTTDEWSKEGIYHKLSLMALSVNDMEKAKEYYELSGVGETETTDEYGRDIREDYEDLSVEYSYYEGSSRLKTVVRTTVDACGQMRVYKWEYNSYDAEGRLLSMTETTTGPDYNTPDRSNVEDYPDYPGYHDQTISTYQYEGNTSLRQENHVAVNWSNGTGKGVTLSESEKAQLSTYDDEGHMISYEDYDEAGNLISRTEFDTEGNIISDTYY